MTTPENKQVRLLFKKLVAKQKVHFPARHEPLDVPKTHGVYVIYKAQEVVHVGRTLRGQNGLYQRLSNHLHGQSSFTEKYRGGSGNKLRKGYSYQYLEVRNGRMRALLEALAVGRLSPAHLGVGT